MLLVFRQETLTHLRSLWGEFPKFKSRSFIKVFESETSIPHRPNPCTVDSVSQWEEILSLTVVVTAVVTVVVTVEVTVVVTDVG